MVNYGYVPFDSYAIGGTKKEKKNELGRIQVSFEKSNISLVSSRLLLSTLFFSLFLYFELKLRSVKIKFFRSKGKVCPTLNYLQNVTESTITRFIEIREEESFICKIGNIYFQEYFTKIDVNF